MKRASEARKRRAAVRHSLACGVPLWRVPSSAEHAEYAYICLWRPPHYVRVYGFGPGYFSRYFTSVSDLRPRQRLRSASTAALVVPATRDSTLASLPDDITTATSLVTFRHKLKTFLFRRPYDNVDSWLLDNLLLFYRFIFFVFIFLAFVF